MNRIDRISAILIQLQSKPIVKAQEIAERFEISHRTVYRDIRALEEAGIPIGSEAGVGYYLSEGYHLPPVMFTKNEAGSMLLAEKLIEKLADKSIEKNFKSAMFKIKAVLKHADKSFLDSLDPYIEIAQLSSDATIEFPNNFMSAIQDAIAHKKIICIQYVSISKNESTKREVEPVGICYYNSNWHMIGFCKLRNEYRDFRIDRIKQLTDTGKYFSGQKKKSLKEYFKLLTEEAQLEKVTVRFSKSVAPYILKQKYYYGFVDAVESDDFLELTFLVTPLEYIAKWLITYGNDVEIVSPPELLKVTRDLIYQLNEHYEKQ